jgi:hypothetical protein
VEIKLNPKRIRTTLIFAAVVFSLNPIVKWAFLSSHKIETRNAMILSQWFFSLLMVVVYIKGGKIGKTAFIIYLIVAISGLVFETNKLFMLDGLNKKLVGAYSYNIIVIAGYMVILFGLSGIKFIGGRSPHN